MLVVGSAFEDGHEDADGVGDAVCGFFLLGGDTILAGASPPRGNVDGGGMCWGFCTVTEGGGSGGGGGGGGHQDVVTGAVTSTITVAAAAELFGGEGVVGLRSNTLAFGGGGEVRECGDLAPPRGDDELDIVLKSGRN